MILAFRFRILDWLFGERNSHPKTRIQFLTSIKIIILFSFLIFGVFACGFRTSKRDGIIISDSKKYEASLYRQNCAICHGKEAYGKTVDGKPVPGLRFGDVKKKTEDEIYQQLVNGKLPMPSFKDQLTEKELRGMVEFIIYDLQAREPVYGSEEKSK